MLSFVLLLILGLEEAEKWEVHEGSLHSLRLFTLVGCEASGQWAP